MPGSNAVHKLFRESKGRKIAWECHEGKKRRGEAKENREECREKSKALENKLFQCYSPTRGPGSLMSTMVFSLYSWFPCEEMFKECQAQEKLTSSVSGKVVLSVKVAESVNNFF